MYFQILAIILPLIGSEASILGYAGYRPGLGLGYNQGYSEGYNQEYSGEYNPVYSGEYNPGYYAGYNHHQGIKYNNPTVDIDQVKPIQPAFNTVPAVPEVFTETTFHENSILPEPIFAVAKSLTPDPVPHVEPVPYNALPIPDPIPAVPHSVAAPAPDSAESSQFHAQDEFGNHEYGYKNVNSAKHEVGSVHGGVRGSYSWRDEAGYHTVHYVADENGYRIVE